MKAVISLLMPGLQSPHRGEPVSIFIDRNAYGQAPMLINSSLLSIITTFGNLAISKAGPSLVFFSVLLADPVNNPVAPQVVTGIRTRHFQNLLQIVFLSLDRYVIQVRVDIPP